MITEVFEDISQSRHFYNWNDKTEYFRKLFSLENKLVELIAIINKISIVSHLLIDFEVALMISEISPQYFSYRNLYVDNLKISKGVYDKEHLFNYKSLQLWRTLEDEDIFRKVRIFDGLLLLNMWFQTINHNNRKSIF